VSSTLPAIPSMEQLRKQAKDLLRGRQTGDPDSLARFRAQASRAGDEPRYADALHLIAREYGFSSWPRLKSYVHRVRAGGDALRHPFSAEIGYYEDRASGLLSVQQGGLADALELFQRHHPRFLGAQQADISAASLTIDDARLVIARQHGFDSWSSLGEHLHSLENGEDEPFMRAFQAMKADDHDALLSLLRRYPGLVAAKGTNGNDLLGLATSMCRVAVVRLLLENGADPGSANDRGWTSLHQAAYGNHEDLTRILLEAGAPTDRSAHGDGGTPLVAALFWGHREAAEQLAARDLTPRNLRVAAGLGRTDLLTELIGPESNLAPTAGAHRGFYRPHTGFPVWQPSDDPQEVLDEALIWAAKSDRTEAMTLLIGRGARVDADIYRGTALGWAAKNNRVAAIRRLLELGADVNGLTSFGGDIEGATALHLAASGDNTEAIAVLLGAGADPDLRDAAFDSTPEGWAEHFSHERSRQMIRAWIQPGSGR
jgi:ankyrin repeat protein